MGKVNKHMYHVSRLLVKVIFALSKYFAIVFTELFIVLLCLRVLYIPETSSLRDTRLVDIFSKFVLSLHFRNTVYGRAEFSAISHVFSFMVPAFCILSKNSA